MLSLDKEATGHLAFVASRKGRDNALSPLLLSASEHARLSC